MATPSKLLTGLILISFMGCQSQQTKHTGSTVGDSPHKVKPIFPKRYDKNESNPLFVFVGEKIEVAEIKDTIRSMDACFRAKYKVLEPIFGEFPGDTLEFLVYDHYGIPDFSQYKNVLLFVSEDSGRYYHQKYLFNDVYKTKDGRWAGCYSQLDYKHPNNKHTKIKPEKIDFPVNVCYPTIKFDAEGRKMNRIYPKPFFKTIGDSAYPVYGNYVAELFKLQRDGVLTARGLFLNGKLKH